MLQKKLIYIHRVGATHPSIFTIQCFSLCFTYEDFAMNEYLTSAEVSSSQTHAALHQQLFWIMCRCDCLCLFVWIGHPSGELMTCPSDCWERVEPRCDPGWQLLWRTRGLSNAACNYISNTDLCINTEFQNIFIVSYWLLETFHVNIFETDLWIWLSSAEEQTHTHGVHTGSSKGSLPSSWVVSAVLCPDQLMWPFTHARLPSTLVQ